MGSNTGSSTMVYFIADTHFGHRNICKYRTQFSNPAEHDEHIISRWNDKIKKKRCQVWVLGDFCIKNKYYDFDEIIGRLHGTIHVITGNHCYTEAYKNIHVAQGLVKKYGFWLSHCPIHPNELRGKRNIHGHVHTETIDDDRYINVCVDVNVYSPVHIDEIRSIA